MAKVKLFFVRDEVAIRLKVYWRVYRKFPESYNATLGIGRVPKTQNRPYNGYSINNKRYIKGVVQNDSATE
jgi:hypothetical protein